MYFQVLPIHLFYLHCGEKDEIFVNIKVKTCYAAVLRHTIAVLQRKARQSIYCVIHFPFCFKWLVVLPLYSAQIPNELNMKREASLNANNHMTFWPDFDHKSILTNIYCRKKWTACDAELSTSIFLIYSVLSWLLVNYKVALLKIRGCWKNTSFIKLTCNIPFR